MTKNQRRQLPPKAGDPVLKQTRPSERAIFRPAAKHRIISAPTFVIRYMEGWKWFNLCYSGGVAHLSHLPRDSMPGQATLQQTAFVAENRRALSGFFVSGILISFLGAILPGWGYHVDPNFVTIGY